MMNKEITIVNFMVSISSNVVDWGHPHSVAWLTGVLAWQAGYLYSSC